MGEVGQYIEFVKDILIVSPGAVVYCKRKYVTSDIEGTTVGIREMEKGTIYRGLDDDIAREEKSRWRPKVVRGDSWCLYLRISSGHCDFVRCSSNSLTEDTFRMQMGNVF
ncbi:hypothetical protein M0802_001586 [Mischocyttarus mexicanus]|nr:hypothetical protein M0802_001586 [Mischocyttarus mexicanus]